jgi:Putative metallopeptidase
MIMRQFAALALISLALMSCSFEPDASEPKEKPNFAALGLDADAFVEGNLYFTGYHELGHGLITELNIPIVGREEDAVDRFATWLMTPEKDEGEPNYLLGAMHGWFMLAAEQPLDTIPWWSGHGIEQQRAYQIACLLYGSDEEQFSKVADAARLPDERLGSCVDEAESNAAAWDKLLEPHMRPEGDVAPESSVKIVYETTKAHADEAAYLKKIGLFEDLSNLLRTNYKLKAGIKLEAKTCDEENAFWTPSTRTLTFCYEYVGKFRDMAGLD